MFSDVVKSIRVSAHLTQAQFAETVGVSSGTISIWERGGRIPGMSMIRKISTLFDVPMENMFDGECVVNEQVESVMTLLNQYRGESKSQHEYLMCACFYPEECLRKALSTAVELLEKTTGMPRDQIYEALICKGVHEVKMEVTDGGE